jgi:hypothetical protein
VILLAHFANIPVWCERRVVSVKWLKIVEATHRRVLKGYLLQPIVLRGIRDRLGLSRLCPGLNQLEFGPTRALM